MVMFYIAAGLALLPNIHVDKEPIYGSDWSMSASAGEWILRSYMGGLQLLVSCSRFPDSEYRGYLSVGYWPPVNYGKAVREVILKYDDGERIIHYPLKPRNDRFFWMADSDGQVHDIVRNLRSLTFSDLIVFDGADVVSISSSTESIETMDLFLEKCNKNRNQSNK
jgi:hypothetical protein